jgi:hypothetical protein
MKAVPIITIAILSGLLLSASCKKHVVQPVNQLSLLPAATQTGANTFGCLIDGQAFVPQNRSILQGPDIQCDYIFTAGGYYFTVVASNKNNSIIKQVNIGTDFLAIAQGQTYALKTYTSGNANASYTLFPTIGEVQYSTNNSTSGQLTITKLDTINQIVSGTFYFKAVNAPGETVSVTDGRFDMPYTK